MLAVPEMLVAALTLTVPVPAVVATVLLFNVTDAWAERVRVPATVIEDNVVRDPLAVSERLFRVEPNVLKLVAAFVLLMLTLPVVSTVKVGVARLFAVMFPEPLVSVTVGAVRFPLMVRLPVLLA